MPDPEFPSEPAEVEADATPARQYRGYTIRRALLWSILYQGVIFFGFGRSRGDIDIRLLLRVGISAWVGYWILAAILIASRRHDFRRRDYFCLTLGFPVLCAIAWGTAVWFLHYRGFPGH